MASGAPAPNGRRDPEIEARLRAAAQAEQASRELTQLLRQAIANPQAQHRYGLCMTVIAWEEQDDGTKHPVILCGLPTGERLEIPLTPANGNIIMDSLAEGLSERGATSAEVETPSQ